MSSPAALAHQAAGAPASQPIFPDEILEEIFLRLDAVEDLARASAACTAFRRVVSARRFLRRFRCLHPPPVLGVLDFDAPGSFRPAEPPHRYARAARALAQAADFTFSFLDTPHLWKVCDARDGRVLLYRRTLVTTAFAELVVCDPVYRRHVQLPPIPDDLRAAAGASDMHEFEYFLDPATDKEKEELDLSFRVICAVHHQHELVIFHFSSITGRWRGINFNRTKPLHPDIFKLPQIIQRHCAYGSFYWKIVGLRSVCMLNMREMIFSDIGYLPSIRSTIGLVGAMVEVPGGRLGLVNLNLSDRVLELYSRTSPYSDAATEVWQHDKTIPLPNINSCWNVVGGAEGYLLLVMIPLDSCTSGSDYFVLDLKTLLIVRFCMTTQHSRRAHMYASFPPPWSLPSI